MRRKKKQLDVFEGKGQRLWKKAKTLIPDGNQLLSKRAERFLPDLWPAYYSKAKGDYIWDLDGRKYLDFSIMAVGACALGYADPDVNRAVKEAVDRGNCATLNSPEEVELAELLIKIHPWAEMVRYARTGGEAMAIAVRIARAYTKKDKIAGHLLPGLEPLGVPSSLTDTAIPFEYNNIKQLKDIVKKYDIGVIIVE